MSQPEQIPVARSLDLCDQVEVLDILVHDENHELDRACFDHLMSPYYPSLQQLFKDVKRESNIVSIKAKLGEEDVTFIATLDDGSSKEYTYSKTDPLIT